MKLGEFEVNFRKFEPFEILPFLPFFQRYLNVVLNVRNDLRKELEKKAVVLEKNPDNQKLKDEYDTIANLLNSEIETASIKMFKNFNSFEWREIKNFIVSHIETWNLTIKNDKEEFVDAPVNGDNFDKIPIYLIPSLLMNVSLMVLDNGSEINFSSTTSESKQKSSK